MNACKVFLFIIFLAHLAIVSCTNPTKEKKLKVGFSQCTMFDDWRKTMVNEMKRELVFYDNIELVLKDAEGDNQKQISQIQELMHEKIDLLIVSPNEADPITPAVEKVFESGIPVIILDRKINSTSYTAYVGADNKYIGETIGRYVANLLNSKGNIIEVQGLKGSTAFIERHQGFSQVISRYPKITITTIEGDWGVKRDAEAAFVKLLTHSSDYDLVFAHNDIMALAAQHAYQNLNISERIDFVGVDGLAGPGGGMESVSKGVLKATALYPTGGDKAIQVASDILTGRSFERENLLKTVVIDSSNVFVMQMQAEKILHQQKDILRQEAKNQEQIQVFNTQRTLIYIMLASLVVLIVVSGIAILAWRDRIEANRKIESKSRQIEAQRDTIAEMAQKAELAIQEKLKFFTNISHEFKTPLTLIMGPSDSLLAEGTELNDRSRQYVLLIKRNATRLLRLINQLMDFKKIEEKKMIIRASENEIIQFTTDIMAAFNDVAKTHKIQFVLKAEQSPIYAWFDPELLDKVIFNLLSNAFKFTPDKGKIIVTISIDRERKNVLIVVEDNGQGMSSESVKHAFDRFYTTETVGGTGLGLSLSKELMELHHGDLVLTSEKGKGTRFCIVLPTGNSHFDQSELQTAPGDHARDPRYDFLEESQTIPEARDGADVVSLKEHTLLIIEDNNELRDFLKAQFAPHYNIQEAADGIEGLRLVFETVPDIVTQIAIETEKQLRAKGASDESIKGLGLPSDKFDPLFQQIYGLLNSGVLHEIQDLCDRYWIFWNNKTKHSFYTSDHPVIGNHHSNNDWKGYEIYFPITPRHGLSILNKNQFIHAAANHGKIVDLEDSEHVKYYNSSILSQCNRQIYSEEMISG